VALIVGTIERSQIMSMSGPYGGIFLAAWAGRVAYWRFARLEERYMQSIP
jgi:hypothetical protein